MISEFEVVRRGGGCIGRLGGCCHRGRCRVEGESSSLVRLMEKDARSDGFKATCVHGT